jgi:O-antigen ligase
MNSLLTPQPLSLSCSRAYAAMLCLIPLLAIVMARSTALAPPLLAAVILLCCSAARRYPRFSPRMWLWAFVFPFLMALSALWSVAPGESFMRAMKILPIALSAPLLWDLGRAMDEKYAALFRRYFPLSVLAGGLFLVTELYVNAPLNAFFTAPHEIFSFSQLNRGTVIFILCVFPAFHCLQYGEYSMQEKNLLAGALAFAVALILWETLSQTVQLAFMVALVFYVLFPFRARAAWIALVIFIIAGLFSAPWAAQFMFDRLAAGAVQVSWLQNAYPADRMEIWDFVSRRALENPVLGFGAEATRALSFDNAEIYHKTSRALHPHNFALQLWIEFGVIGVGIAAFFLTDLLRCLRRLEIRHARFLLPLLAACLSVALTSYGLWQSWWIGTLSLLAGTAAVVMKDGPHIRS